MNVTLKTYQERAVDSAVAVFDHCRRMLDAAGDDAQGRATAVHDNGYLLIEAPTGSGKTLMAGNIVERVSSVDRVVWFWFAPFKGVVEQSAGFLREQFPGLRLRTLGEDRQSTGTRPGDTFVTTWQLVATRIRDRRSVRTTGEQNGSVDDLILALRQQGFRIGVVVDEAHHGFHGETQAAVFFRTVLQPEYTVLITATPDDADLADLQQRMQSGPLHRITISRADAVGDGTRAGLIKSGIKCVAWRVEEGSDALVDFQATALREATTLHKLLKAALADAKVNLTPLMLVQVDSSKGSVDKAKATLISLGFTDAQIATHTADEPDSGLMSLANDETREVLIFKMAVALGFDAPRAWTLVSMRASRDEDFGVQLVGRVLRVHRRLQGRVLPDALKYGYVLLADIDAQGGIDAAGQRINQLETSFAQVSPTTVVLRIGDRDLVQSVGADGQTTFLPAPAVGSVYVPPRSTRIADEGAELAQSELFAGALWTAADQRSAVASALRTPAPPIAGRFQYPLRAGVPRQFKTQDINEDRDVTEEQCAEHFIVSAEQILDTLMGRERVRVNKRTLDIFTQEIQMELAFAKPSLEQMRQRAQRSLMASDYFSPKELRAALMRRLHLQMASRGVEDASDSVRLGEYLDVLLVQYPELLKDAQKKALYAAAEISNAAPLPDAMHSESALPASKSNVYGRYPVGLNNWERAFAEYLDADDSQTILWWHRNPANKPWSINVILDNGRGFYPDFVIGVKNRQRDDNGLLADTKYAFETRAELPKLLADHKAYGRVLIITKNQSNRWTLAGRNAVTGTAQLGEPFRILSAATY